MADDYGATLRRRRRALGLSQRELAARAGVTQPVIAAAESGRRGVAPETRRRLDGALACRPSVVLDRHRARVREVITRHHGHEPLVVGSVARGDDTPGSDLDLMVTFDAGTDLVDLLGLVDDLEELLGVKVDIMSGAVRGVVTDHARHDAVPL